MKNLDYENLENWYESRMTGKELARLFSLNACNENFSIREFAESVTSDSPVAQYKMFTVMKACMVYWAMANNYDDRYDEPIRFSKKNFCVKL